MKYITQQRWIFEALDSWFFREMRPFQVTGADLGSLFPPPARTIMGAVRSIIGNRIHVDWEQYRKGQGKFHSAGELDLCEEIGNPKSSNQEQEFGKLQLTSVYLLKDKERLYPVPQHLLQVETEEEQFCWLKPDKPLMCDLGYVRLPVVYPTNKQKVKPLSNVWVNAENLNKILSNKKPDKTCKASDLFVRESRIGIGLDEARKQRTVEEGKLYQMSHVRLRDGVALGVDVNGVDSRLQPENNTIFHTHLGGEGRVATVCCDSVVNSVKTPVNKDSKQIILVLLTPLLLPEKGNFFMPFESAIKEKNNDDSDCWRVTLKTVTLKIISGVLGKSQREGGWNLAEGKPRALRSLVPAGSVWFCEVIEGDPSTLHGIKIGEETALGRGELAVGIWQ